MPLYQIVDCSFKSDGSGRAYGYKIPQSWEPRIGQKLKVPDSSGDGWKLVTIVKLDGKEIPNVPYKWGLELVTDEPVASAFPATDAPTWAGWDLYINRKKFGNILKMDVAYPETWGLYYEVDGQITRQDTRDTEEQAREALLFAATNTASAPPQDFGGALIGKALAADLASPDPVALRQTEAKPFVPAPPHPGTPDPFASDEW